MSVALFTHPSAAGHDTGPDHPECAARITAVLAALDHPHFSGLLRELAPPATPEMLRAAHTAAHVDAMLALAPDSFTQIDADTFHSPGSREAALRAAGGACAAVDAVMQGWATAAFVAMRPPGHHAESDRAMGFCLFNNAAIAAHHARNRWGLARIAVADFDVHHGNGTQDIFARDPGLFYASSHQSPCYPGTGAADETGVGNIHNAPLAPGSGGAEFRAAWSDNLLPALDAFAPQLLIISAGFDAHAADPLAQLRCREADFTWITDALLAIAGKHQARIVSLLEGGYDLAALASSTAAHVRALMSAS